MKPSVGRIVHYYVEGSTQSHGFTQKPQKLTVGPFAAIIVSVNESETVNLAVFQNPPSSHLTSVTDVPNAPEPKAHHWTWPRIG